MPLLSPSQIHQVLKSEDISPLKKKDPDSLEKLLERTNLTKEEVLEQISFEMKCGDTSTSRVAAARIGLELNGLGKNDDIKPMNVTIIINDSQFNGYNPILIPR
jgi:hypothetical protein